MKSTTRLCRPSFALAALNSLLLFALGCENEDSTGEPSGVSSVGSAGEGGAVGAGGATNVSTANGASTSGAGGAPNPIDFLDVYPLATTYPEGAAFDLESESFYVGSLEGGLVVRVNARTGVESVLHEETTIGTWMTLGMTVDTVRRTLWVCAADRDTDPYYGEIWGFDLESGQRTSAVALHTGAEYAWCEDLAVDSAGDVYATDRENPNIYRVALGQSQATIFASHPELGSNILGQNGIVVLPGDEALIAAIHFPARLNRIEIPSGIVTPIEIHGDFADATFGSGADGAVLVDNVLYVVFDGELVKVEPVLSNWSVVNATELELTGGLTDVVHTPGGLFLANGQAIGFAFGQAPKPFSLVRVAPF